MCMGNGEWEPDPRKVKCKNDSILQTRKRLLSRDGVIAVVSSVTVFVVAAIVYTIMGFLCGHYCCQARKKCYAETARSFEEMYTQCSLL